MLRLDTFTTTVFWLCIVAPIFFENRHDACRSNVADARHRDAACGRRQDGGRAARRMTVKDLRCLRSAASQSSAGAAAVRLLATSLLQLRMPWFTWPLLVAPLSTAAPASASAAASTLRLPHRRAGVVNDGPLGCRTRSSSADQRRLPVPRVTAVGVALAAPTRRSA